MNEREKSALKHGLIKLFLTPNELALVVSCLDWVKVELKIADDELKKLDTPIVEPIRSQIRSETFTMLLPVIESTVKHVLVESIAHFDERDGAEGKADLQEKMDKLEKTTAKIQQFRELVSMGIWLQATSQQKKED